MHIFYFVYGVSQFRVLFDILASLQLKYQTRAILNPCKL